jgi:protein phosphatase 2C family protein 2/3
MATGNLALSRALGDFEFKQNRNLPAEQQIVTADPDIITHKATSEDEFLIIACDGIWDVLKNQEAVDFVRRCIAQRKELHEIAEFIMDRCLAPDSDWGGVGCDNMTVVLVALLNGRTKEEWYDWMVERVEKNVGYST